MNQFSFSRMARMFCVLCVAAAIAGPAVFAQNLSDDLIRKDELSAADVEQIKTFVDRLRPELSKGGVELRRAKGQLTSPLERARVSVATRKEFANNLLPTLTSLAKDPSDLVAANALMIAGEIATSSSMPILRDGLSDKRASVRFAAAHGLERAFRATIRTSPAIDEDSIRAAISSLKAAGDKEADRGVVDGIAAALSTAISRRDSKGHAAAAMTSLSDLMSARTKAAIKDPAATNSAEIDLLVRTLRAMRDELVADTGQSNALTGPAKTSAARFAGQLLMLVASEASTMTKDEGRSAAATADGIISIASGTSGSRLDAIFTSQSPAEFASAVAKVTDAMTKPPLSIPASEFKP
jgi:hypothetical protein